MYGYIYETICKPTGKKYIGLHKTDKTTINNGLINKYVFQEDLDDYLNQGWKLGMIKRK